MSKTVLSFYCDDVNPYDAPASALKTFLDFAASEGIAGEASFIPAYQWEQHGVIRRSTSSNQSAFVEQAARAFECGLDTHFELMTHGGLFDFQDQRIPGGAIHEGVWMFEPAVSVQEYETYLAHIITEGQRCGVRYTGLTQPGCGCPACTRRFQELGKSEDPAQVNPNLWQALLNLAKAGAFRGPSVPCFFGGEEPHASAHRMASEGIYSVYDLPPNTGDHFGLWLNSPEHVQPDYYISADGQSGRLVDLVRARAPYALFYCHWQGFNPANGVGWQAFTRVVERIHQHLEDQITWMRPSAYTQQLHQAATGAPS